MAATNDLTTLVCLFHHRSQAEAALKDLLKAGVSQSSISVFDKSDPQGTQQNELLALGVPARDQKHLEEGLQDGGVIVAVSAESALVSDVERIFGDHSATKIDEAAVEGTSAAPLVAAATGVAAEGTAIPIVEEELAVGKRTVDAGGVRVYRRVVEIPVEESINLREEHVNVTRRAVDRPASEADLSQGNRTIELTETAEEAVVGKNARVVEELVVGKNATERTEHIHDTVRRTEVEVEEVAPDSTRDPLDREL